MTKKTSLVVPAYNEEQALRRVIDEALPFVDEVVVVDDGSTDGTLAIAESYAGDDRRVRVVSHERNRGKVAALHTGVAAAEGDMVVFTDADYTYPARFIAALVAEIQNGADLAIGSRFLGGDPPMPPLNKVGNRVFSALASFITGTRISDGQSGFRAFKQTRFSSLDVPAKSLEYETKMTVRAAKFGFRVVEVPITYRHRIGESKLNPFTDGVAMFFALLEVAYRETSLLAKTVMVPSLVFVSLGVLIGVSSIVSLGFGLALSPVVSFTSLVLLLVGLQLLAVSFLADNLTKKMDRVQETFMRVPRR